MPAQVWIELPRTLAACGIRRQARLARSAGGRLLDVRNIEPGEPAVALEDAAIHHGEADVGALRARKQCLDQRHVGIEVGRAGAHE